MKTINQLLFKLEVATYISKQEHLIDVDDQVRCLREVIYDLNEEVQRQEAAHTQELPDKT